MTREYAVRVTTAAGSVAIYCTRPPGSRERAEESRGFLRQRYEGEAKAMKKRDRRKYEIIVRSISEWRVAK